MLIAQITDTHIGFDPGDVDEFNRQRLDLILGRIGEGPNRPDALILSGDLADKGDLEAELGGLEGEDITGGSGSDDSDIKHLRFLI